MKKRIAATILAVVLLTAFYVFGMRAILFDFGCFADDTLMIRELEYRYSNVLPTITVPGRGPSGQHLSPRPPSIASLSAIRPVRTIR